MEDFIIMKVWISKYTLTSGILLEECLLNENGNTVKIINKFICFVEIITKDYWHITEQEAIENACIMRDQTIKNTKKILNQLKNMKFEVQKNA